MVARRGAAHAHVATHRNDWYHNDGPSLRTALERLSQPFERVMLYGASMGGYGALLLSGVVEADRVVAVAPQFSVDPPQPPFKTRWRHLMQNVDFGHDGLDAHASASAAKYIVYDPGYRDDAAQAAILSQQTNAHLVRRPCAGHYPARFLH
jgi:esterase/lipase